MEKDTEPKPDEGSEKDLPWTSGETSMTDMSDEERKKHLGYTPGPGEPSLEERERQSKSNASGSEENAND